MSIVKMYERDGEWFTPVEVAGRTMLLPLHDTGLIELNDSFSESRLPSTWKECNGEDLVELQSFDGTKVGFCALGGGFLKYAHAVEFLTAYEPYELEDTLRPAWIGGDWMEACYPAWAYERRWNGWAVPAFTSRQIEDMFERGYIKGEGIDAFFRDGRLVVVDDDGEHVMEKVNVGGEEVHVMDLGWCFDFCGWRE